MFARMGRSVTPYKNCFLETVAKETARKSGFVLQKKLPLFLEPQSYCFPC